MEVLTARIETAVALAEPETMPQKIERCRVRARLLRQRANESLEWADKFDAAADRAAGIEVSMPDLPPPDPSPTMSVTCPHCGNDSEHPVFVLSEKHPHPMPVLMLSEIMGVEENEVGDVAVLDTGSSQSFISAAAAEKVVANMAEGTYTVETNERASFRFANGETGICSSVLKIHETSDLPEMSFAVMETKE